MKTHCQPCIGKSTDTDCSTCVTALIEHIEQQEYRLGVAPDDAYVKTQNTALLYICSFDDIANNEKQPFDTERLSP